MRPPFFQSLRNFFSDGAFRFALKFGLAGVLTVYVTLVLRLQESVWALLTVFVLMIAQYMGAIAEKSFFRLVGTIAGAIIGYLLTAGLEQNPVIFLLLMGLVVGVCTAMFGQARFPYTFLLCGLTTIVVASNGMANPDQSWKYMLARVEEVTVGIIVALLVQCVIWPRYARVEFLSNLHRSFGDLKECFATAAGIARNHPDPRGAIEAEDFPARISALDNLLKFGARESRYFRDRMPAYFELIGCLGRLASAISTFREPLPTRSLYHEWIGEEMRAMHQAVENALEDLHQDGSNQASRAQCLSELHRSFEKIETKLAEIRSDPRLQTIPAPEAMIFGIHVLSLDQMRLVIARCHELIDSLPAPLQKSSCKPEPIMSPWPPPFWIHSGIKSALAVAIALVIDNWLNPPGGSMFMLGTWVFTALNATSPRGEGDRRAFHYAVLSIGTLAILSCLLLAARPLLSSYAVMNTIIFTWMFVWGYLSYNARGMTIPMQVGMLCLIGILNLNGQEPISFQAITDFFFGISLAVMLSAIVQRLLWPSLPQWEVRDRLVELVDLGRRLIREDPNQLPLWQKVRQELIPDEAHLRINLLKPPICPKEEPESLKTILRTLTRINGHLLVARGQLLPLAPPEYAKAAAGMISHAETLYESQLAHLKQTFEQTRQAENDEGDLQKFLKDWDQWIGDLRHWMLAHGKPSYDLLRFLGFAERYRLAGEGLLAARKQVTTLRFPLYMGDYAL